MKLTKRREPEPSAADTVEEPTEPGAGKGRATPKRRDAAGRRGPVIAPKNRKEAYARQKTQAKTARSVSRNTTGRMTGAERRAALKSGDPSVLPRRDQGQTRKLARDYVDSRRMASNYLLVLFPLMFLSFALPILQLVVFAAFLGFIGEWYVTGKRIRTLAIQRYGSADGGNLSIGFYAGSRAYLRRAWRLPAPQVQLGEEI